MIPVHKMSPINEHEELEKRATVGQVKRKTSQPVDQTTHRKKSINEKMLHQQILNNSKNDKQSEKLVNKSKNLSEIEREFEEVLQAKKRKTTFISSKERTFSKKKYSKLSRNRSHGEEEYDSNQKDSRDHE